MSFGAISSIAIGAGLTAYGSYKYITASRKPDVNYQKNINLAFVTAGVIAIAAGLIYYSSTTESQEENFDTITTIEEVAKCPINALKDILNAKGSDSITAKTFKVLEENQGISCDNYLPWQNKFHRSETGGIDGIRSEDMKKSVMWGIDPFKGPYMAFRYVCDLTQVGLRALSQPGAMALSQRCTDLSCDKLVPGGHVQPCDLSASLNPVTSGFFDCLTSFLNKGYLISKSVKTFCICNLPE